MTWTEHFSNTSDSRLQLNSRLQLERHVISVEKTTLWVDTISLCCGFDSLQG